jgi:hypothetical protein
MMIKIYDSEPPVIAGKKPIQVYETRYVYTGFRRYDVYRKVLAEFVETVNGLIMKEMPMELDVFSRGYSVENATVSVYSESPRIWKEVMNPFVTHYFVEEPRLHHQQEVVTTSTA